MTATIAHTRITEDWFTDEETMQSVEKRLSRPGYTVTLDHAVTGAPTLRVATPFITLSGSPDDYIVHGPDGPVIVVKTEMARAQYTADAVVDDDIELPDVRES